MLPIVPSSKIIQSLLSLVSVNLYNPLYCYLLQAVGGYPAAHQSPPVVYVSDGGHFENLGIYELLRRRCKTIYSFDAGNDPSTHLDDLFNALALAKRDGFVESFDYIDEIPAHDVPDAKDAHAAPQLVRNQSDSMLNGNGHEAKREQRRSDEKGISTRIADLGHENHLLTRSKGRIALIKVTYNQWEEQGIFSSSTGIIWYVKSTLTGSEQPEIAVFALGNPLFPFHPTSQITFDHRTFRSYEDLGSLSAKELLEMETKAKSRRNWFSQTFPN